MEQEIKSTPSSTWYVNGEPDPHVGHYDKERARLCLGQYTDDEIANGAFLNYGRPLNVALIEANDPDYHSPIAWMTGVKERIRWLSRALTKSHEECLALRQRLAKYEDV